MQQSNFPVILYDIDNNTLPINCISKSNNFFFRSYQLFSVEIIEDTVSNNLLYSVIQNPAPINPPDDLFIISSDKSFSAVNYSYTLYIESSCTIKVTGIDGVTRLYHISFKPDNVLTDDQDHYNDLLINNRLPSFTELEPAIISEDKADMIKRLLLDFKKIVNKKGTKEGIIRFLNLIGFNPESIAVYDEYKTPNDSRTLSPNKLVDIKTGYYHVLYDNWTVNPEDRYTIKNLPKRIITITDLEEFFKKLWYAIVLANKYFTLPEQDISFFGLSNSSNIEKYLSIAGNTSIIDKYDVHYFRKFIGIDLYNHEDSINKTFLVKNKLQIGNTTYNSEIKTYSTTEPSNNELYLVDYEIFDDGNLPDDIIPEDQLNIKSLFGNLLHLVITSPNTYVEYVIEKVDNELTKITQNKIWITEPIHLRIVSKLTGLYRITLYIYDIHNNREKYIYYYTISNDIAKVDFEIYNSTNLYDEDTNNLTTDIESSWLITEVNPDNFILPINNVPDFLDTYFQQDPNNARFIDSIRRFGINKINGNFIVDNSTDTIPVDFMDNYLHVIAIAYNPNHQLKLRYFNDESQHEQYLDYYDTWTNASLNSTDNKLFVTVMDIVNPENDPLDLEDIVPYLYISTTEVGIDLTPEMYDLLLYDTEDQILTSIYELENKLETKIPLNFDIPLFFRQSDLVPDFVHFPDYIPFPDEDTNYSTLPVVQSLYPKLINIKSNNNTYIVKLGDIILCRPDPLYITAHTNIVWKVINSFTGEEIFTTTDYMLKYRINDNMIYTIQLEFNIEGTLYHISKASVQSSFEH